jgi:uridine phosphorylase
MESEMLFKMPGVYNLAAAAVCAVVAQRTMSEDINYVIKKGFSYQ